MIYRELGSSGISVSAVGLGTWSLSGWAWPGTEEVKAIDGIQAAIDHGVNLLDTAPTYGSGRSEEIVGRAIRGRREKVILATKCGLVYEPRETSTIFCEYKADGTTNRPSETVYLCLQPGITSVLCGARDPEHAIENAAAGEISLCAEEMETVNDLLGAYGGSPDAKTP
jgi:aryl-alcohol dehydrogenase-like predicted oxidoreductase